MKKVFKRMCKCFALCSMLWDQPLGIATKCLMSLMAIVMVTFWAAILILPCSAVLLVLFELSWKEFVWIALVMYGAIWVIELATGFSWGLEKIDDSPQTLDESIKEEDQKAESTSGEKRELVPPERKPKINTVEREDASQVEALATRRKEPAPYSTESINEECTLPENEPENKPEIISETEFVPSEGKPEIDTAEREDTSRVEALAKRRKEIAPPFSRMICCGYDLTVGLKSDGTVIAVGEDEESRFIAKDWSDIVAFSQGSYHMVGLKPNGTVVAVTESGKSMDFAKDWSDIVAICVGYDHTLGLRSDGTVVASPFTGGQVDNWYDIVAISAGECHAVGLKADGTVIASVIDYEMMYDCGNDFGQCNVGNWKNIVAIGAGVSHTVGLKADGTVVAVGDNRDGQCNVSGWRDIVAINSGDFHTVGLKSDGTVVAVGSNEDGRCDVDDWRDIVAISAGDYHTVGLKSDGSVVAVGENDCGQCNVGDWKLFETCSLTENPESIPEDGKGSKG